MPVSRPDEGQHDTGQRGYKILLQEDGRRDVLQGALAEIALPAELTARGWKLIIRAPDRMFAISEAWGCTGTKGTINEVVTEAWGLVQFCEYVNRQRVEDGTHD